MIVKRLLLLLLLALKVIQAASQTTAVDSACRNDLGFINYLIGKAQYEDASWEIEKHLQKPGLSLYTKDTLYALLGWSYYSVKKLEKSTEIFERVSPASPSYLKARFFAAYNQTYLGNYSHSLALLDSLDLKEPWQQELRAFEHAGISLLNRDTLGFRQHATAFTNEFYSLATEEYNLGTYHKKIQAFRNKKPWKAACLSALVPGLGKIYAGKLGEGISSFLIVTALGAVSYENFHKDGILDIKTLFFSSLFTVYYVGNVWGSAYAVSRHNNQFRYEIDQEILFDLHIPLRTIFN